MATNVSQAELTERLARLLGTPEEALERLRAMDRCLNFASKHMEAWRRELPDTWVGVHDEKLSAVAPSREALIAKLEAADVPLADAYIRFVSATKQETVY